MIEVLSTRGQLDYTHEKIINVAHLSFILKFVHNNSMGAHDIEETEML